MDDPRNWSRSIGSEFSRMTGYDDDEDEDDDEEEDRSLDLFVKFVQNVFKKISRRARRAVRSVLPIPIPTKLVQILTKFTRFKCAIMNLIIESDFFHCAMLLF